MRSLKTKKVEAFGMRFIVYSIGWLAALTGRTSWTIRRWQRDGFLPAPLLKFGETYDRWYSAAELRGYAKIVKNANVRRRVHIEDTPFKQDAHTFKMNLRKAVEHDPSVLGRYLEGAETINQALAQAREAKWKKKLDRLLS